MKSMEALPKRTVLVLAVVGVVFSSSWAHSHKSAHAEATVEASKFGALKDGTAVDMYTLKNAKGSIAKVITYGATLVELWVPDKEGKLGDVVLGFDNIQGYEAKHPWFGATVGRVANRIAKGKFTLDGHEYSLEINDPPNTLHSGSHDLSRRVWKAEPLHEKNSAGVKFSYLSPDGDEGFPGNFDVSVVYRLTNDNELKIEYTGKTDKATPVNMTNHSYFNLGSGKDVLDEVMYIEADNYTPVGTGLIPSGEIAPVKETPLDFSKPVAIGTHIAEMKGNPGGYDHNFVLRKKAGGMTLAARVFAPSSGRQMEVWTNEPGVQFYSGNFLDGTLTGKRGAVYGQHAALCLETQHFPDSVNQPKFPSVILRPGATYHTETIYKFSAG